METFPEKVDVVGTGISATTLRDVVDHILSPPDEGLMVAISNVHAVMTARKDQALAKALTGADIATTDGMPLAWALRWLGHAGQERVGGLKVHLATIEAGLEDRVGHFFYGSTPETLDRMERNLRARYPEVNITGMYSPPYGPIDEEELDKVLAEIRDSRTKVVWVGLGVPKQEVWIHQVRDRLPGVSLVGVGAVYDWVAGNVSVAPEWMQNAGLEWFYRLMKEPRRLWRRYIYNNPAYLVLLAGQVVMHKVRRSKGGNS
jgi:N-acetylglucosaminyldiphosphoundecaprenol N-acetyl-beta-D-mannosaminyltransferase